MPRWSCRRGTSTGRRPEAAPAAPRLAVPAEEPGPERAPPSPGRKGAAGSKGPRAEPVAPPAGGGLGGRLAAWLRWALGLRRAGRGRTWTALFLAAFATVLALEPYNTPL
ncbi:probable C-mannosyltransferase DPY19L1 [Trachypithecus francoisi]|uniref:probable C-mannosyltransferase DPY19L1 n=1 Tax=Trachypithecus francoisi TaxID=54180 RepID=UPI00141AF0AA|nr:probable C-mannosyltransferase DPY19L1 [Trachypithecus francoisi]XP_033067143.1 probable C-mannosyltransferase DPY19L1 [Trachypithecus francoisi]